MDQGGNYWTLFTPGIWKVLHAVLESSGHQGSDEGAEQSFAAAARVVHELEEAEIVPR
jgi:hypothetical protein